ncbi:hypothetical protein HK405_003418, partial [Cladochytrium tenue]
LFIMVMDEMVERTNVEGMLDEAVTQHLVRAVKVSEIYPILVLTRKLGGRQRDIVTSELRDHSPDKLTYEGHSTTEDVAPTIESRDEKAPQEKVPIQLRPSGPSLFGNQLSGAVAASPADVDSMFADIIASDTNGRQAQAPTPDALAPKPQTVLSTIAKEPSGVAT